MGLSLQVSDDEQYAVICQDGAGDVTAVFVGKGTDTDAKDAIPQIRALTRLDGEWITRRIAGTVSHGRSRRSGS